MADETKGAQGPPTKSWQGKRKQWIVDREFQLRFLGFSAFTTLSYLLVTVVCCLVTVYQVARIQAEGLSPHEITQYWYLWALAVIVMMTLLLLQGLVLSHRIAGPAYRLEKVMREMMDGSYPEFVTVRPSDYLKRLASALTDLSQMLAGRQRQIRRVDETLSDIMADPGFSGLPPEIRDRLKSLHEEVSTLRAGQRATAKPAEARAASAQAGSSA